MTSIIGVLVFWFIPCIEAVSIPSVRDGQSSTPGDPARTSWSRQDIFTLIGVCVAITSILVGLLVALPGLRGWLCKPFHRKLNPHSTHHT
jgi:hypothetical protein